MPKLYHAVMELDTITFMSTEERDIFLLHVPNGDFVLCESEISQEDFDRVLNWADAETPN